MENCLFCKIIRREIPAEVVYEDEKFFAFLDINPVSIGHTLLIPKDHHAWVQDVPDMLLSEAFITAKKIILSIKKELRADFVQISVVGKDVPHFHIHLIPRYFNDGLVGWATKKYKEGEMKDVLEKIREGLK